MTLVVRRRSVGFPKIVDFLSGYECPVGPLTSTSRGVRVKKKKKEMRLPSLQHGHRWVNYHLLAAIRTRICLFLVGPHAPHTGQRFQPANDLIPCPLAPNPLAQSSQLVSSQWTCCLTGLPSWAWPSRKRNSVMRGHSRSTLIPGSHFSMLIDSAWSGWLRGEKAEERKAPGKRGNAAVSSRKISPSNQRR